MDTKDFFAFIDYVYAFNGTKRTVDALCDGTLRFGRWYNIISNKRRKFESCAFNNCIESQDFKKHLTIYHNKLETTVERYKKSQWLKVKYDIKTNKRNYYEQKYHEVRSKEITTAYKFLHSLLNDEETVSNIERKQVLETTDCYHLNYSDKQLERIYNELICSSFLEPATRLNDFIYYFTGRGEKPAKQLLWNHDIKGWKVNLALFVNAFCRDENRYWKIAESIFGVKGLAQSNSNSAYTQKDHEVFERLKRSLLE